MNNEPMSTTPTETVVRHPPRNRRWIWFFLVVVLLSALAIGVILGYNWILQLTPDQIKSAQTLWQERGPKNYDLHYVVVAKGSGSAVSNTYQVEVRNGVVTWATLNKDPVDLEKRQNHSMTALLADVKTFLDVDAQPDSPWAMSWARFDESDGHLLWYVRKTIGTRQAVKIEVKELRVLD